MARRHAALRLAMLSWIVLAAFAGQSLRADEIVSRDNFAAAKRRTGGHYYIDFHARARPSITGHNFVVFGRLNADGGVAESHVEGFTPDSDRYWAALIIPVPGLLGSDKADFNEPSVVVYRRFLTQAEYHRVIEEVRYVRSMHPTWHLIFSNCNDFVGEIAKSIGLLRPPSLLPPAVYVTLLRALNGA